MLCWLWLLMYGCVAWPTYKPIPKALSLKFSRKLAAYTLVYTVNGLDQDIDHFFVDTRWYVSRLRRWDQGNNPANESLMTGTTYRWTYQAIKHWYCTLLNGVFWMVLYCLVVFWNSVLDCVSVWLLHFYFIWYGWSAAASMLIVSVILCLNADAAACQRQTKQQRTCLMTCLAARTEQMQLAMPSVSSTDSNFFSTYQAPLRRILKRLSYVPRNKAIMMTAITIIIMLQPPFLPAL